ncbi:MAG TPA: radical SAM protein [Candidatus Acidoferrales bacterium]|nr:radical SAM protein [Candidatus Acidoferrales bacterium]
MHSKYSLSPHVILRFEPQYYGSYSAFNYKTVKSQTLTAEEIRVLKYIQTKPAVSQEITQETNMNEKGCERFLKEMQKQGFVQINTQPTASAPQTQVNPDFYSRFPIPFLSAPATIDFFITSRCNLHCAHCYADKKEHQASNYPLTAIEAVFDQLEQLGVLEVRISGGEPLLHKGILQILGLMGKKRFRKILLTNGTLLTEETVMALKDSGITPTISLDDCIPEAHDQFRGGTGAHARTINGLALLQKHGVEYGINSCLNKNNLNRYQDIINLCIKYGAARITLLDLKPTGRMRNNTQWMPTHEEYSALLKKLFVARAKNRKIDVSVDTFLHCYPMQESVALVKKGIVSCRAGVSRLSIDSDGSIYPCNFVVGDPRWVMGNLKEQSLEQIWFSQKWLFFRGQTTLKDLKTCGDCKKRKDCVDLYCRLLPYEAVGDEYGVSQRCQPKI